MDEVTAEVVEEKVPEPEWDPFIVQYQYDAGGDSGVLAFKTIEEAMEDAAACRADGYSARILRVTAPPPPKRQRVGIEWDAVERVRYDAVAIMPKDDLLGCMGPIPEQLRRLVERHARIVTEEVQP